MPFDRLVRNGPGTFHSFFYGELTVGFPGASPHACLPRDPEAHALWYYLCLATKTWQEAKANIVLEGDPDAQFKPKEMFEGVAVMFQVSPTKMCRYWDVVEKQRRALGGEREALPERFKLRGWGN